MAWVYDDGGRVAAGYSARPTGDCVVRAIAIATQRPYAEVRARVAEFSPDEPERGSHRKATDYAERGYEDLLREYGWEWVPTMRIGQGCRVHLRADELPAGRIIARLSKHLCAVVDGIIHDLSDPSRDGTRCVYGYYIKGN
jgi:hypothetical protein